MINHAADKAHCAGCGSASAAEFFDNISLRRIQTLDDLGKLAAVSGAVLGAGKLDPLTRAIMRDVKGGAERLLEKFSGGELLDRPALAEWAALHSWFFFALESGSYCSPAVARENTAHQRGAVRLPPRIKYMRSEANTSAYSGPFDRNTALIRTEGADSFRELAAEYIVSVPAKKPAGFAPGAESLLDFAARPENRRSLIVADLNDANRQSLAEQSEKLISASAGGAFDGALYFRAAGAVPEAFKNKLQACILLNKSNAQILVEEDYDPLMSGGSGVRLVSFIHNQNHKLRYQLLQDAASMGYRPTLDHIVRYYYAAGRLEEILESSGDASSAPGAARPEPLERTLQDAEEQERDYQLLIAAVEGCLNTLADARPAGELESGILDHARKEGEEILGKLAAFLQSPDASVDQIARTFHDCFHRLRTLAQCSAFLADRTNPQPREMLERQMEQCEGGVVLACNCGMTAARAVISELAGKAGQVFSTAHYWEIDHLLENLLSRNPHYPELPSGAPSRLRHVPHCASRGEIDRIVCEMAADNAGCGGQLLCLDRSISPFFYTKTFDLEYFAASLSRRAPAFVNPVYLVVDNTLDFDRIKAATLFPGGLPQNVFLIFTLSQAKLHQLGFDAVTGGIINIHSSAQQTKEALRLGEILRERLRSENSLQSTYGMRFLLQTFYWHYANGTMPAYVGSMLGKRHRNTAALVAEMAKCLGSCVVKRADGLYEYRDPRSGGNELLLQDPDRPGDTHRLAVSFHFEPGSCIHGYLKILEPPSERYIAGPIFEELKRRLFEFGAAEGINLADGTSWGFTITRLDWYMHTMRVAVGLEHRRTLTRLGTIFGSVLKDFIQHPNDFLRGVEVVPFDRRIVRQREGELMALDRLIPHDPGHRTPVEYYLGDRPGQHDYSFAVLAGGKLSALLFAYLQEDRGQQVIYLSKAATAAEMQGRGCFKRMLEYLKDRARADGIHKIVLQTSAGTRNQGVVRAYEKCGFRACGLKGQMLQNGWPLILVDMELNLNSPAAPAEKQFTPVSDAVYQRIKQSGSLEMLSDLSR